MRRLTTAVLSSVLLVGAGAVPVAATAPQPVTILVTKPLGDLNAGSFTASGGVSDSGGFLQSDFHDTAIGAPTIAVSHYVDTFTGRLGTFVAKVNSITDFSSFPILVEDGEWVVTSGTAAYAGLKGHGKFRKVVDIPEGTVTISFVGIVF
jgi:hypothetical protein